MNGPKKEHCPVCGWHHKIMERDCSRCERKKEVANYPAQKLIDLVVLRKYCQVPIPPGLHKTIIKYHDESANRFDIGQSYYIYGPSGKGKTCRAYSILLEVMRANELPGPKRSCEVINVPMLMHDIRAAMFRPQKQKQSDSGEQYMAEDVRIMKMYCDMDWLCLDDIGAISPTEHAFNILYSIINYRYEHGKATVFTSNLSLNELDTQFDDDRIPSRIKNICMLVHIK